MLEESGQVDGKEQVSMQEIKNNKRNQGTCRRCTATDSNQVGTQNVVVKRVRRDAVTG